LNERTSNRRDSINISETKVMFLGRVFQCQVIISKNIIVDLGTINVNKQGIAKFDSQYTTALQEFSNKVNQRLKGHQVPEDQVQEINQRLNELAKEIKYIKSGLEEKIDYEKQKNIEPKPVGITQRVLKVLPQAVETVSTFTPLAPFSKLVRKGVEQLFDEISSRKNI
jgi:hypothetical protein